MPNQSSQLIQTLTESMDKVSHANSNIEINIIIEHLLKDFTDSEFATLFLFDSKKRVLFTKKEKDEALSVIDSKSLLGEAFLTKAPAFYNHIFSEKNYLQEVDNPEDLKIKSQVIVPIIDADNDNLLGIVKVARSIKFSKVYSRHEVELLSSLTPFISKIINILSSEKTSDYKSEKIDTSKINEQIRETEKRSEVKINSAMLFFANTVHDIRTPANSLYGFLELMEEYTQDKKMRTFIENAKESAKFINTLTDSILEQTKQAHEVQVSKPSSVNSINFFAKTANIFSANMSNKNIHYLVHIDHSIPKEITIDELKIKRIIINLIGNAYKFTPKGKIVDFTVRFNSVNKKIKICVIDQGIGIEESRQKDIFEAFKQAEADTSEHFGGTGLGLAICAKYVADLGGELKLESIVGEGSRFYFEIPITISNSEPTYTKLEDFDKKITILSDDKNCIDANQISAYIIDLGMPSSNITITDTISDDTTHLFCFQHKVTPEIIEMAKEKSIVVVFVEESLFALTKDFTDEDFTIISENTYYGDTIYDAIFSLKKKRVLIADDNKINIMLLQSMLETEHVDISYSLDGKESFDLLKKAHKDKKPFDIIFLDKHMPNMTGTEVIRKMREFEKTNRVIPIYAISITGDSDITDEEKNLYNLFVNKPFNKLKVRESVNID
ncbi:MAG: ATP-binding protein [Sulfurovum sp.]